MRRQIYGTLLVCATALALGACASNPPASATGATPGAAALAAVVAESSNSAAAPLGVPATAAAKDKALKPGNGYRLVHKNGEEYYCQKQAVLGSRARVAETCLTLAELTQLRETGQDMVNRVQGSPGAAQQMDSSGGVYNSAVSNPNTTGY